MASRTGQGRIRGRREEVKRLGEHVGWVKRDLVAFLLVSLTLIRLIFFFEYKELIKAWVSVYIVLLSFLSYLIFSFSFWCMSWSP